MWRVCALLVLTGCATSSQEGLVDEVLLHPLDGFTAHTLPAGEFVYNQSVGTIPLPSWAWIGVTDWLTAEIDLLPLIGGFFLPPHLPVPSFNFRFRILDGARTGPTISYETMFQYLWNSFVQEDADYIKITRRGGSWYNRVNISQPLGERVWLHGSLGFTWAEDVTYQAQDKPEGEPGVPVGAPVRFQGAFHPDASLSIDWRAAPWISVHATTSYGTTFVYLDNVPRKFQVMAGVRVAPFWDWDIGILKTFRLEFPAWLFYFGDVGRVSIQPLPIIPYAYWQFTVF